MISHSILFVYSSPPSMQNAPSLGNSETQMTDKPLMIICWKSNYTNFKPEYLQCGCNFIRISVIQCTLLSVIHKPEEITAI